MSSVIFGFVVLAPCKLLPLVFGSVKQPFATYFPMGDFCVGGLNAVLLYRLNALGPPQISGSDPIQRIWQV